MEHVEKCAKGSDDFGNLQFFVGFFFFNSLTLNFLECAMFPCRFGRLTPGRDLVTECELETRTKRRFGPVLSLWNCSQIFPSSVSWPRQQGDSSEAGPGAGAHSRVRFQQTPPAGLLTLILLEPRAGHVPMHFGSRPRSPLCAHHAGGRGFLTGHRGALSKCDGPQDTRPVRESSGQHSPS